MQFQDNLVVSWPNFGELFSKWNVLAQSGQNVLNPVVGTGLADGLEHCHFQLRLKALKPSIVINKMEERLVGVADKNGKIEGYAEQLAESGSPCLVGLKVRISIAKLRMKVEITFTMGW